MFYAVCCWSHTSAPEGTTSLAVSSRPSRSHFIFLLWTKVYPEGKAVFHMCPRRQSHQGLSRAVITSLIHRPLSFLKQRTNNTSRDICSGTSVSSCLIAAEVCSALVGLCTEPGGLHRSGWFGVVPGLGMGWQERIFLPFSPIRVLMSPGSCVRDHHGRFCGKLWVVQPRSEGKEGFWGQLHSSRGAGGTLPGMSLKPSLFGETSQKMLLFNFIDL